MKTVPIPAIPFMQIVKQFAFAKGLKFATIKQQNEAILLYNEMAVKKN